MVALPHAEVVHRQRFALHGPAVEIECAVPEVGAQLEHFLSHFAVDEWPGGFSAVSGAVRAYDAAEVVRCVSPTARPMPRTQDLAELYEEGERFWLVDEQWGMLELNFLKGNWRSWVLPQPQVDSVRRAEMAVLWPLAQLLRPRGLYLLPSVSAVRDGWAFLLLCPFNAGPDLAALARAGYQIIGQRWTAVREEEGRLALLHVPGAVYRGPRLRTAVGGGDGVSDWVDLYDAFPRAKQHHAFCDAVLVAEPGRRPRASLRDVAEPAEALHLLRQAWPIVELHPHRRHSPLPLRMSQVCRCAEVQLSRKPADLVTLLDDVQAAAAA